MIRALILAVCCMMFPSLCLAVGWETVQSALKNIHAGWNLANSLDAVRNDLPYGSKVSDFETGWGQPVTTPEIIHKMKEAGFNAIRVPVTTASGTLSSTHTVLARRRQPSRTLSCRRMW